MVSQSGFCALTRLLGNNYLVKQRFIVGHIENTIGHFNGGIFTAADLKTLHLHVYLS